MGEPDVVDVLAEMLNRKLPAQIDELRTILFTSLGHAAVANGDIQQLDDLIVRGFDINMPNLHDQRTILHTAAALGKENVVKFLIDRGACVQPSDHKGRTPLMVVEIVLNL